MRKLRVSLLDQCHFRCVYCMPAANHHPHFLEKENWLSKDEIQNIAYNMIQLGIEEIRLTGGEPTLRPDLIEIVQKLSELPLKKLGMTTNGERLTTDPHLLPSLWKFGCHHLNISLDSLQEHKFRAATGSSHWNKVVKAIKVAKEMGFNVKVNMVLMKSFNDREVEDFIQFASELDVEVRFLELIKIGVIIERHAELFVPAQVVIDRLIENDKYQLTLQECPEDSTAFLYHVSSPFHSSKKAKIGFIASESRPFCGSCSRLRLTAQGHLQACLMKKDAIELRDLPFEQYPEALRSLLKYKPTGRIEQYESPMYQIGG